MYMETEKIFHNLGRRHYGLRNHAHSCFSKIHESKEEDFFLRIHVFSLYVYTRPAIRHVPWPKSDEFYSFCRRLYWNHNPAFGFFNMCLSRNSWKFCPFDYYALATRHKVVWSQIHFSFYKDIKIYLKRSKKCRIVNGRCTTNDRRRPISIGHIGNSMIW